MTPGRAEPVAKQVTGTLTDGKETSTCKAAPGSVSVAGTTTGPVTVTFTHPTSAKACTASFVRQVTITFAVSPLQVVLVGSVAGVASNFTCATDPLTDGGSCLVDAGVMTFTAPAVDTSCTANFGI